jgi:hypothetical protein
LIVVGFADAWQSIGCWNTVNFNKSESCKDGGIIVSGKGKQLKLPLGDLNP